MWPLKAGGSPMATCRSCEQLTSAFVEIENIVNTLFLFTLAILVLTLAWPSLTFGLAVIS